MSESELEKGTRRIWEEWDAERLREGRPDLTRSGMLEQRKREMEIASALRLMKATTKH